MDMDRRETDNDRPQGMPEERMLSSRRVYEGRILNLRVDEVEMENGRRVLREVVEHEAAVGILALTGRESLLLVRQFRYAVGEKTLEICAGLVEKSETPKEAAVREMREELGYSPGTLREIGRIYASPGFCTELLVLFLAMDLSVARLPQDEDENVAAEEVRYEDIPDMLAKGIFRDAKTFSALCWFMSWKNNLLHLL
jgi:ADP-ribose pyrophosphatase